MASPKTPKKASVYIPGFLENKVDIKPSVERELKRISEAFSLVLEKAGSGGGGTGGGSGGIPSGLNVTYNPNGTANFTYPDPNDPSQTVTVVVGIAGSNNLVDNSTTVNKAVQDIIDLSVKLTQEAQDRQQQASDMAQHLADEIQQRADADTLLATEMVNRFIAEETARTAAISKETQDRTTALQNERDARAQAIRDNEALWKTAISDQKTYIDNANNHLVDMISSISAGTGDAFDPSNIWYFDTTTQGWTANPGTISVDADGWLHPAGSGTVDAVLESPPSSDTTNWVPFSSAAYRYLRMRIKRIGNPVWKGQIGWRTVTDTGYPAANVMTIPEPDPSIWSKDGDIVTIDFHDIPWNAATVDQIKVDLTAAGTSNDLIVYDWISIGRPTPGAGMAALQNESLARQSGDFAEAASRQTLVTNLTGGYGSKPGETGDTSKITSGIIFAERKVWGDALNQEAADRLSLATTVRDNKAEADRQLLTLTNTTKSQSTDITNLKNTVNGDPANPGSGLSQAVTTLDSKVTKNVGDISKNTQEINSISTQVTQLTSSVNNLSGTNLFPNGTFEIYANGAQVNQPLANGQPNKWLVASSSNKFSGNRGAIATRGAPDTDTMNEMLVGSPTRGRRSAYYYAEIYVAKNPAYKGTSGQLKFGIKSTSANGAQNVYDGITIDVSTLTTAYQKFHGYFQCSYQPTAPSLPNPANEITTIQPVFWYPKANNSAGVSVLIDNALVMEANGEFIADANAKAIETLTATNTQQGKDISSVSSRTTTLENDVNTMKTGKAEATAVNALTQKVTKNESDISTVQANYTKLNTRVGNAETSVADLIANGNNFILNGTFPTNSSHWTTTPGAVWSANTGDGKSGFVLTRTATNTFPTILAEKVPAVSGRYYRAVVRMKANVADTVVTVKNSFYNATDAQPFDVFDRTVKVGTAWADYDITWHASLDGSGADQLSPDGTSYLSLSVGNRAANSVVSVSSVYLFDDTGGIANSATAGALETLSNEVHQSNTGLSSVSQKIISLNNQLFKDDRIKSATGSNIFPDGTFESYAVGSMTGSTGTSATQIVAKPTTGTAEPQPHAGTKCLQYLRPDSTATTSPWRSYLGRSTYMDSVSGSMRTEDRRINLRAGGTYNFEAWVKLLDAPSAGKNTFSMGLSYTTTASTSETPLSALSLDFTPTTALNTWVKKTGHLTLPTNAVDGRIYIGLSSDTAGSGSKILIDDVVISDATDATTVGAAAAKATSDLSSRVDQNEDTIKSQAQSITSLQAQVSGVKTDPQNQVSDGDFSSGNSEDFWTIPSTSKGHVDFTQYDATQGVTLQLKPITPTPGPVRAQQGGLQIRNGRTYRVSCKYRFGTTTVVNVAGDCGLFARTDATNGIALGHAYFTKATTPTWTLASFEFTANADAKAYIFASANVTTSDIRVDDIRFEDVTDTNTLGAQATVISGLTADVKAAQGNIQSNTSSITRLESTLGTPTMQVLYNWEFDNNTDITDWVYTNSKGTQGPSSVLITPTSTTSTDVQMRANVSIVGSIYNVVKIRMRCTNGTVPANSKTELYWGTKDHGFVGTYQCQFDISGIDNNWKIITLDLSTPTTGLTTTASNDWKNSTITSLRLDPVNSRTLVMEIDFITVGKVGNTGSVSAINTINTHLEASDEAIAAAQLAQAEGFNQQRAQIGANDTKITVTQTSIADLEHSMSERIVALDAKTDKTSSDVTALTRVVADNKSTAATAVQTLESKVDNNNTSLSASVSTVSSTAAGINGKVEAKWGVSTSVVANGVRAVGGISLGMNENRQSAFIVQADQFQVWNGGSSVTAPFFVSGGQTFINSAVIQNGSIDNAKIGNQISSNNWNDAWPDQGGNGWCIRKDGTSYFNNGYFRGSVFANNGYFNGTVNASGGVFNNVRIEENCDVHGTIYANRIVGDIVNMFTLPGGVFSTSASHSHDFFRQVVWNGGVPYDTTISVPTFVAFNQNATYNGGLSAYIMINGRTVMEKSLGNKLEFNAGGKDYNQQNYVPLTASMDIGANSGGVVIRVGVRGGANGNTGGINISPAIVLISKRNGGAFSSYSGS